MSGGEIEIGPFTLHLSALLAGFIGGFSASVYMWWRERKKKRKRQREVRELWERWDEIERKRRER